MENPIAKFEGNEIEFSFQDETLMINTTEISKIFGKKPYDFLKQASTKAFIEELKSAIQAKRMDAGSTRSSGNEVLVDENVVRIDRGGDANGITWMHRQLALKFAAWLSPKFEVWIYQKIDSILYGDYSEVITSVSKQAALELKLKNLNEAHQASPEVKLFYSDSAKLEKEINQVKSQRNKRIRAQIDGQMDLFKS